MAPQKGIRLTGAFLASFGALLAVHEAVPHEHPWEAPAAHAAESTERFVSDLSPELSGQIQLDADADGGTLVLAAQHAKGLGMRVFGDYASATLNVPDGCTGFAATIGHDNGSVGTNVRFRVMRFTPSFVEFSNQTISRGSGSDPTDIAVPVTGGEVILEGAGNGLGDWGSARFTGCPGIPTPTPTVAATATPTSPPAVGICPKSLHDSYIAVGPDGRTYPTWHPQQHVSGCYFGHEHGSDPSLFHPTWKPAFGYVAVGANFPEPHEGFKGYALPDDDDGYRWYISHHFGTAGAGRVCTRFHEIQWAVTEVATNRLVAHVAFMGDYGRAENNDSHEQYHPSACPNQADDAINDESFAARQIPMGQDGTAYEPWRIDGHKIVNVLGFDPTDLVINTRDSITRCADLVCNQLVLSDARGDGIPRMGDDRFLTNNQAGAHFTGGRSGTFHTNPFGTGEGSVQQFINAGLTARISFGAHCRYVQDNRMPVLCDGNDNPVNIDRMLRSPN